MKIKYEIRINPNHKVNGKEQMGLYFKEPKKLFTPQYWRMLDCSYEFKELIELAADHAKNWKRPLVLWESEIEINQ